MGSILITVFALSHDFDGDCQITECFEEASKKRAGAIWWGVSTGLAGLGMVVWSKTRGKKGTDTA